MKHKVTDDGWKVPRVTGRVTHTNQEDGWMTGEVVTPQGLATWFYEMGELSMTFVWKGRERRRRISTVNRSMITRTVSAFVREVVNHA